MILFLIEYPGLTVKVDNGQYLKPGDLVVTRTGDTATVLKVSADTVTFNKFVVHGYCSKIQN